MHLRRHRPREVGVRLKHEAPGDDQLRDDSRREDRPLADVADDEVEHLLECCQELAAHAEEMDQMAEHDSECVTVHPLAMAQIVQRKEEPPRALPGVAKDPRAAVQREAQKLEKRLVEMLVVPLEPVLLELHNDHAVKQRARALPQSDDIRIVNVRRGRGHLPRDVRRVVH